MQQAESLQGYASSSGLGSNQLFVVQMLHEVSAPAQKPFSASHTHPSPHPETLRGCSGIIGPVSHCLSRTRGRNIRLFKDESKVI